MQHSVMQQVHTAIVGAKLAGQTSPLSPYTESSVGPEEPYLSEKTGASAAGAAGAAEECAEGRVPKARTPVPQTTWRDSQNYTKEQLRWMEDFVVTKRAEVVARQAAETAANKAEECKQEPAAGTSSSGVEEAILVQLAT